ncbi:hypothetical protein [Rhizobium leguminosarum]|uniref:hypothetical protein n=1 Tax=Rhizobium leguminosarum TaxID=384 RepID=UPI00102FFEC8|nr:hypothetical protein [Rhizobium leguminosarum]TAY68442.1 hypothetical protein ELH82_20785 [Rhizobium leguminosarum]
MNEAKRESQMPDMGIAVAWLEREDWPEWEKIDRDIPPYERWKEKIDAATAAATSKHQAWVKVIVRPGPFVAWCSQNGRQVSSQARAEYAASLMMLRQAH